MERVIDVRLRIHYEPRFFRPWIALGLFFLTAGEVASENVTLSTYYPAPSGIYTQLVTTGQTILARDGGNVGVGTSTPATKLDVNGGVRVIAPGGAGVGSVPIELQSNSTFLDSKDGGGSYRFAINNDAGPVLDFYGSDAGWFNYMSVDNSGGRSINFGAGNVAIGSAMPAGTRRGYLYINNANTGCAEQDVTQGPVCGAGFYAAFRPGLYIEGWDYANRGGQVLVEAGPGQDSSQVWGLNNCSISGAGCTGNAQWMTLRKNDSVAHIFCCPL